MNVFGVFYQKIVLFSFVDPGRIELPPPQCECGVMPLYYGPRNPSQNHLPAVLHAIFSYPAGLCGQRYFDMGSRFQNTITEKAGNKNLQYIFCTVEESYKKPPDCHRSGLRYSIRFIFFLAAWMLSSRTSMMMPRSFLRLFLLSLVIVNGGVMRIAEMPASRNKTPRSLA